MESPSCSATSPLTHIKTRRVSALALRQVSPTQVYVKQGWKADAYLLEAMLDPFIPVVEHIQPFDLPLSGHFNSNILFSAKKYKEMTKFLRKEVLFAPLNIVLQYVSHLIAQINYLTFLLTFAQHYDKLLRYRNRIDQNSLLIATLNQ